VEKPPLDPSDSWKRDKESSARLAAIAGLERGEGFPLQDIFIKIYLLILLFLIINQYQNK